MIIFRASTELRQTFDTLLDNMKYPVQWTGIFIVENDRVVLKGTSRSMVLSFGDKSAKTDIIDTRYRETDVLGAAGNLMVINSVNMLLYVFGRWGSIRLKVDKEYAQLNALFNIILKSVGVEVDFNQQRLIFSREGRRLTYEDVLDLCFNPPEPDIPEEEHGLWHDLSWKRNDQDFDRVDVTVDEKLGARLGDNFYAVGYLCPKCKSSMYMSVFPPKNPFPIDTQEGKVLLARVCTCENCNTFYTPIPRRLLCEGLAYEMDFGDDEAAYKDYRDLLGRMGTREPNTGFNKYADGRDDGLEDENLPLDEACLELEDMSDEDLEHLNARMEEGFYSDDDLKEYEERIQEVNRQREETRRQIEEEVERNRLEQEQQEAKVREEREGMEAGSFGDYPEPEFEPDGEPYEGSYREQEPDHGSVQGLYGEDEPEPDYGASQEPAPKKELDVIYPSNLYGSKRQEEFVPEDTDFLEYAKKMYSPEEDDREESDNYEYNREEYEPEDDIGDMDAGESHSNEPDIERPAVFTGRGSRLTGKANPDWRDPEDEIEEDEPENYRSSVNSYDYREEDKEDSYKRSYSPYDREEEEDKDKDENREDTFKRPQVIIGRGSRLTGKAGAAGPDPEDDIPQIGYERYKPEIKYGALSNPESREISSRPVRRYSDPLAQGSVGKKKSKSPGKAGLNDNGSQSSVLDGVKGLFSGLFGRKSPEDKDKGDSGKGDKGKKTSKKKESKGFFSFFSKKKKTVKDTELIEDKELETVLLRDGTKADDDHKLSSKDMVVKGTTANNTAVYDMENLDNTEALSNDTNHDRGGIEAAKEDPVSQSGITEPEKANSEQVRDKAAIKKSVDELIKKAPKRNRTDLVNLVEQLNIADPEGEFAAPYIPVIMDKVKDLDQKIISKMTQDIPDQGADASMDAFMSIMDSDLLPELKEDVLGQLGRRIASLKGQESELLCNKLIKEFQDLGLEEPEKHHYYHAKQILEGGWDPDEVELMETAMETYGIGLGPFEYPVLIVDTTRGQTGKSGMILTPDHIFISSLMSKECVDIPDVEEIEYIGGLFGKSIICRCADGQKVKLPYAVSSGDLEDYALALDGFVTYLQSRPDSRGVEYMSQTHHDTTICFRCGHTYYGNGECPKCGYKNRH